MAGFHPGRLFRSQSDPIAGPQGRLFYGPPVGLPTKEKPRQRQGSRMERFWESVLVSTPEERSHSSHLQTITAGFQRSQASGAETQVALGRGAPQGLAALSPGLSG